MKTLIVIVKQNKNSDGVSTSIEKVGDEKLWKVIKEDVLEELLREMHKNILTQ